MPEYKPMSNEQLLDEEQKMDKTKSSQNVMTQLGKTPEEILPYLLSGEPDD